MGLFNIFRNEQQEQKLCKLRDFIVLSYADGEFTDTEKMYIISVLKEENIDIQNLSNILPDLSAIRDAYPTTEEEKIKYLVQMIMLMIADGECSEKEISFCKVIAKRLGLSTALITGFFASMIDKIDLENDEMAMDIVLSYFANGGLKF